jgi:hypothetical protein
MALPELLFPSTLPLFMAAAHIVTPEGLYVQVDRMSGGSRRRRVFLTAPRILEASVELTQSQLEDFFAWHEGPLRAGEFPFTAPVAKMGTGLEYWSAICLSFKAEHLEGSHHKLSLRLRLKGTPEATPPVVTSMFAAVSIVLNMSANDPTLNQMYAEAGVILQVTFDEGAALAAEVAFRLFTEFDGPSASNINLDAEVYIPLEFVGVVDVSASLAAEVVVALLGTFIEDLILAAEVSVGLVTSITPTGPVTSPGSITDSAASLWPYTTSCVIALQIWADGRVYIRKNSSAAVYAENWYLPTTSGVGSSYWVKVAKTLGVVSGGGTENASLYRPISSTVFWTITEYVVGGTQTDTATVTIASDPDGVNVLSTFTCNLTAIYDV